MKLSNILLITACICTFVGCGEKKTETIKIVVAGPLTGDNAEYGNGFKNAVQMSADKWNKNGGVLGKKIIIEAYDDKNNGEEAATIAEKVSSDKNVIAVVGHFASGVCMAASPTYQEKGIIQISPSASHPDYSKEGDYIFRNNTVINVEAEEAVKLALNALQKNKVGVLSIRTDWGTSTAKITNTLITELGGNLVGHEEVVEGSDDYSPNITKLQNAGAEVIIVAGMYNTLAPFAKQYKEINPNIEFVGFSNAYSQQLIDLGGKAVENVHFPTIFFHASEKPNIKNFVKEYEEKYKGKPSSLTAQAYDSAEIIFEAVKKAGTIERKKVKEAIYTIEYDGITGNTKFDKLGDAQKTFTKAKVQDGTFVEIGQ